MVAHRWHSDGVEVGKGEVLIYFPSLGDENPGETLLFYQWLPVDLRKQTLNSPSVDPTKVTYLHLYPLGSEQVKK